MSKPDKENPNPEDSDDPDSDDLTCRWCKMAFKNKGNLASHAYHMHADKSYQLAEKTHKCHICDISFGLRFQLKYHIRRQHYNLHARQPYCDLKKVNQVWFEKVLNSNAIVEMKKLEQNMLLIRKLDENTSIKVNDNVTEVIDLHKLYPTGRANSTVECKICLKRYNMNNIKKHMEEIHYKLVKHRCNNCNSTFKRSYHYLKHNCTKKKARKVTGVLKEFDKTIKISSVESYTVPT